MYTVKGALERSEGNFASAIAAYQRSIDLQMHLCKAGCPKLGIEYSLRAEAYGMLGNHSQAITDYQRSLSLLRTAGQSSRDYLRIELAYAAVLRADGSLAEAQRLETEAQSGLEKLRRVQCNGCTISAESFR